MAVYDAMARGLPKGWYAWHSLRIRVPGQRDAETDFVIADPARGILIIEVKGGLIEERDGRWYSNGSLLKQPPREQANRFLSAFLALLHKNGIYPPSCGIATFFPDTAFSAPPGESDVAGCVLGRQDLNRLHKALPKKYGDRQRCPRACGTAAICDSIRAWDSEACHRISI